MLITRCKGLSFKPSKQIKNSVEHNPDAVYEMPIKLSGLKTKMIRGCDASVRAGLQGHDRNANHTQGYVEPVKSGEGLKGARKKVVG